MRSVLPLVISVCALGAAADAPYAGKWKMNVEKSDFGHSTLTYEQLSGGEMKATMDGQSYTFKMDGKDVMTPWGMTLAWKAVDANTWETTEKTSGKVTATGTMKLSSDGKTLTMNAKRNKTDGGVSDDSMVFQRVHGGPGLAGQWKTKILKSSSPETLELSQKGSDGVTITIGNMGAVCDAKFDGKDHPVQGSMFPSGWTCVVAKKGARGLGLTWKKDGKPMYQTELTAAADGKMLTETGSAAAVNEPFKVVYDRQ